MNPPISDADLMALNVFMEARGESKDGQAAVAKVVLNRTRMKYCSHGTIESTILWPNAFSWTQWAMVHNIYQRIAFTQAQQEAHVYSCFVNSEKNIGWTLVKNVTDAVLNGTFKSPAFDHITDDTVLYYNPSATRGIPSWADPNKLVTVIGRHWFFSA
jgi:spore germination cell wall hydrolase CwlJ-like protein